MILRPDADSAVSHYGDCWPPYKKQFDLADRPKRKKKKKNTRNGEKWSRTEGQKSSVCVGREQRRLKRQIRFRDDGIGSGKRLTWEGNASRSLCFYAPALRVRSAGAAIEGQRCSTQAGGLEGTVWATAAHIAHSDINNCMNVLELYVFNDWTGWGGYPWSYCVNGSLSNL